MSLVITARGLDGAITKMRDALDGIGGKQGAKIIATAMNQALAAGRKTAAKEARRAYTAPIKKLFDNVRIARARGTNLAGQLEISGSRGVSLIHFQAEPDAPQPPALRPKEGVSAKIRRQGARKVRRGPNGGSKSFVMKKAQGGFGVFVRHGKRKFEMLYGPSPVQALQRKDAQEEVTQAIEEAFEPRLAAEIDKALARIAAR